MLKNTETNITHKEKLPEARRKESERGKEERNGRGKGWCQKLERKF